MKTVVAFAALSALALAAGSAQAAPRYTGALVVFATSGTCEDYDPIGTQMLVRFQPGGIGDNPPNTGFTFLFGGGGYNLTVPGAITNKLKTGTLTQIFDYGSSGGKAKIKFSTQVPGAILPDTSTVFAIGDITDFDGMIGCTVSFRFAGVKRLN